MLRVLIISVLFVYFLYTFVFDPRVGRYEKSKMFINIINGIILLFNTTEIKYKLFPKLIYPENIQDWKRGTWNHSQFLFNNIQLKVLTRIINESSCGIFTVTLLGVSRYQFSRYVWYVNKKSKTNNNTKQNIMKHT